VGQFVDRAVEHVVQYWMALLHVLGEDRVDQLPVDLLILDRHLPGHHHADDRLAATPAGAAGLMEDDVLTAGGGDVLAKLFDHLIATGGMLAGGRADLDTDGLAGGRFLQRGFGSLGQSLELFRNFLGSHGYPQNVAGEIVAAIRKDLISAKTIRRVKDQPLAKFRPIE
jgi:hypothetical protein